MNTAKSFFTMLLIAGILIAPVRVKTAGAFILRDESTRSSYCYVSFPATQGESPANAKAFLERPETRVNDFDAACDRQKHINDLEEGLEKFDLRQNSIRQE